MGETREGFIETRIIHAQLRLKFAGTHTAVMKPGMPLEGHVNLIQTQIINMHILLLT